MTPVPGPALIIAVDGPAASGKGTIAKALARHYNLPHLDTGLLYRAVAATVRRSAAARPCTSRGCGSCVTIPARRR